MADDWGNDPIQSMGMSETEAHATFDKVFGKGKWSLTGGFRTPEREAQLRAAGAGTVPPGQTSKHSEGTSNAPGAYDLVVSDMSPAQAAKMLKKSGVDFAKVLAEGAHGDEGAHLHVEAHPQFHDDWGNDPIVQPKPDAAKVPSKPGLLDQVGAAVKKDVRDIGHEYMEAGRAQKAIADRGFGAGKGNEGLGAGILEYGENALRAVSAPLTVMARNAVGEPVEHATGSKLAGKVAETAVDLGVPFAGELKAASEVAKLAKAEGVSKDVAQRILKERARMTPPNTLKAATEAAGSGSETEHAAAVKRLEAAGVRPAAHQREGGLVARVTESAKSNPYTGEGVRAAEKDANDSFNRALYNKVLAPIGEGVNARAPIGNDGVALVERQLSRAYDEVLPHVRLVGDQKLTDHLADIRTGVAKLGKPQEQQYEAILNQDVLHHFQAGGMDGKTFKIVESDLLRQARNLKGSPDPNARSLGGALEETLDALRQDMIDHSPAEYRSKLQNINKSYAMFTRLQDAAAARKLGGGEITPSDLLGAVKKGDRTIRKGSFARGDALLQQFAQDGQRVLGSKVSDSGTTERTLANRLLGGHGVIGGLAGASVAGPVGAMLGAGADMALSSGTNMLARRMLSRAPRTAVTRNYLKAAEQRTRGQYLPSPGISPDQLP